MRRRSGRLSTLSHDKLKREEPERQEGVADKDTKAVEKAVKVRLNHSATSGSSGDNKVLKLRFLLHSSNASSSTSLETVSADKKTITKDEQPCKPRKKKKKKKHKTLGGFCHECGKLGRLKSPLLHCSRSNCKLAFHADCLLLPVTTVANKKWSCPCHVDVAAEAAFPKDFDVNRLPAQPITLLKRMKCKEQSVNKQCIAVPDFIMSIYQEKLPAYKMAFIN